MIMNSDLRKRTVRTFFNNKAALFGLAISIIVVVICVSAPFLPIPDPIDQSMANRFRPPGKNYPLGTDNFGRDVLSRIIWGGRISMMVGVLSVGVAMILGTIIGLVAGYKGGYTDNITMRIIDVLMCFPTLILGILFMAALGSGMRSLIIAIGIAMTPRFVRICRGSVLGVKENDFVQAARSMGMTNARIMFRHILPNVIGDMIVMGTLWVGAIIIFEASLSFIGLGVPPPIPSWGRMVKEGINFLSHAYWVSVYSGLAIFVTVIGFNLLGDGLRDIMDPKLRE
ncbi:MAG TPA: ABC transporter permease [Desulfobacteraceae bacterium]|nr:ABC transporter permease [Desulfobacteraceae bacterium]